MTQHEIFTTLAIAEDLAYTKAEQQAVKKVKELFEVAIDLVKHPNSVVRILSTTNPNNALTITF